MIRQIRLSALLFTAVSSLGLSCSALADLPIAGVTPSQRPESAPTITEATRTPEWYEQSLTGVSKPYPASLNFLESQGNWYTPFNHPGMLEPYDIRGWHTR